MDGDILMLQALAATDLSQVTRPKEVGNRLNANVICAVPERQPDYEGMRKLVSAPLEVIEGVGAEKQSKGK